MSADAVKVRLNALQLDVLAAAARGEVYRQNSSPYTAYRREQRRAITKTVDGLWHRSLLCLGDRGRFTRLLLPTEAGYAALAARGCTEDNGYRVPSTGGTDR